MNKRYKLQKNNKKNGFSMLEIIIVMTVIGIIAAIASVTMGGTIGSSRQKAKEANARVMNEMIDEVRSLGGEVAANSTADIDITSIATVIASLTKTPGLEIEGITFKLKPKPNVKGYELDASSAEDMVKALDNKESA